MVKKPAPQPVTHIGSPLALRLHIQEWIDKSGLSDETIAGRIQLVERDGSVREGVSRETVFRWRKEPWRLDVSKLSALAKALSIEPDDFYHHPDRPSVDALLKDVSKDEHNRIRNAVLSLISKAS